MIEVLYPKDVALHDYWAHIAEVSVQLVAVLLLLWAVNLARRSNKTAMDALADAKKDLEAERAEYAKAMTSQRYDALDRTYMDLVLLRVQHPDFNDPGRLYAESLSEAAAEQRRRYDSYAFALFNYLETIADKCSDELKAAPAGGTPDLVETWGPILVSESWQHRFWFTERSSRVDDRFKEKFRKLVANVIAARSKDEIVEPVTLLRTAYA
ncbi:MAG: hypothetical protein NW223_18640 [Hyphomicrobiaceae bacterium]|nr:hypothetical protein [Hyphomicrobiaceae bacterium]